MNWKTITPHPDLAKTIIPCCGQQPTIRKKRWQYHGKDYRVECESCGRIVQVLYVSAAEFAVKRWNRELDEAGEGAPS